MNKTFSGVVSEQIGPTGVSIIVLDGSRSMVATLSATTDTTGAFSVTADIPAGRGYIATASVAADSKYNGAASLPVTFDVVIPLEDRTVTLGIS